MQRISEQAGPVQHWAGLSTVVDVFDQSDLFEEIDNQKVVDFSRLNGSPGFSGVDSVRKSTGISVRRILREGLTATDLGEALCRRVQQSTGSLLTDFDAVLLCHSHTDPEECQRLAASLRDRLDVPPTVITAFNYGCCGFLKLLQDASELLDEQPNFRRLLLLSVETPETWHDAADRLFCGLVSAGATAVVVEKDRGCPISVVRTEDFGIPAERRPNPHPLFSKDTCDAFTFRGIPVRRTVMRMNSEPVFLNGIELMLNNLRSAMLSLDVQSGQRVVVAPHQPSGKLLRALVAAAKTEFPEVEFLNNLDQYGNTISSSIPVILARLPEVLKANGRLPLRHGDHLVLLAAGICMTELSDHMAAGYACIQWAQTTEYTPHFDELRQPVVTMAEV